MTEVCASSVEAFVNPLGRAGRFGMTPKQQRVYRVLASQLDDGEFRLVEAARAAAISRFYAHDFLALLIERGWVERDGTLYRLTDPVMTFKECTS